MAGEIVQTLFGVSPESYQQQQSALADQQALQYARLSPFQQANYAIGRGAYQIAGALGGEDPELQLISARNSIAKQINYADLNSIAQGVQMLGNAGDTVGAMQLADVYRKAQSEAALTTQRQREALTPEQRNSDAYAKQFGAPGSPEYQTAFKQKFDELTSKPAKDIYAPIDPSKYTPASLLAFEASGKRSDLVAITPKENVFSPIDVSKFTPESLKVFNVSRDRSDLVAITPKDNLYAAIDPSKYTPESLLAFEKSGKRSDLVAITPKENLYAAINPSDYTPASLLAFEASGKRSDLVVRDKPFAPPPPERVFAAINPSEYTPASIAAFEASGNRSDLVAREKPVAATPDRLFAPINVSDFTPASVAAFEASGNRADLVAIPKTNKPESTMGKVDIDKFTPASLAKYAKSGDYLDLVAIPPKPTGGGGGVDADKVQSSKMTPDGTTILVMKNGTTRVISALGDELKGQARADAIRASEQFGAETQGTRAQSRGLGELSSKQVGTAFAEIAKVKKNIGNIDDAIAAIDAGANTGVIASKLPTITAASIQLANVRQQLGLDVIGSVTFGALSEGELNLALDTALPTNLQPKDLRVYLTNKKNSQTKLAGYLTEQATYLTKPGNTLAGWLEKVENKAALPAGVTVKRK